MRVIHIRRAGSMDTRQMAELLNTIIEKGGTTAKTEKVSLTDLERYIRHYSGRNAWFLAEDDVGSVLGFQYIEPNESLPSDAADIATFVKIGETGHGIGSKLFERTKLAAHDLGYAWINATIRADNTGGLAYYQSRGFEDYATQENVKLKDGSCVSKIKKRFNLR